MTLKADREKDIFKVSSFQKPRKDKIFTGKQKWKCLLSSGLYTIKELLKDILWGEGKWSQKESLRCKKEW